MRIASILYVAGILLIVLLLSVALEWLRENFHIPISMGDLLFTGLQVFIWFFIYSNIKCELKKIKQKKRKKKVIPSFYPSQMIKKIDPNSQPMWVVIACVLGCLMFCVMGFLLSIYSWGEGLLVYDDSPRGGAHGYTHFTAGISIIFFSLYGCYYMVLMFMKKIGINLPEKK